MRKVLQPLLNFGATMWRALFLAACVGCFQVTLSCDDDGPVPTPEPNTQEPSCGCGEHPPICGKNEVYDDCKTKSCRPTKCSELGYPLDCDKRCKPGCKCKDGYVLNDKGVCIRKEDCPSCGGDKNAQSGCGTNCGKRCGDKEGKPLPCPLGCNLNGCDCRDGYKYDSNQKKCVKKEDCTPICTGDEVYSPCANGGCGPKNCSQINDPYICIDPICKKGCVCKDGYLRDANGKCIPKDQCPKCPPTCDKNEEYDDCKTSPCRPTKCSELGFPLDCDKRCKPGCKCKDGYVRNDKGVCIRIKDCPSCGGDKNAESGCGTNCGKTCDSIGKPKPVPCPKICKFNSCDCRDGYYYDPNQKKCVRKEDCTQTCKENEVYSSCTNGGCGPKKCSEINDPIKCVDPAPCDCIKGCICKEGYLRSDNGTCIPKNQCPQNCNGPNEYYEPCIINCGSQNCSDVGKIYDCDKRVPGKCDSCGCQCKRGYLRNAKGVCIPEKDCPPPTCPKGEIWDKCPTVPCEGDNCPKTRDSPQTCPTGIVCSPPRCVCSILDKRDKNGKCIRASDCPPFPCDGPNEHYESCPGCPGDKCSDHLSGSKCPPYKIGVVVPCRPACRCDKGHCRNDKGKCVPSCECGPEPTTQKPTPPPCD